MTIHELYLWTEGERLIIEVSAPSRKEAKTKAREKYGDNAIIFYKGISTANEGENYADEKEN